MAYRQDQILTGALNSRLYFTEYSANKSEARLGDIVKIRMDFGDYERRNIKAKDFILEYDAAINPAADPASHYRLTTIYALWDDYELYINNRRVARNIYTGNREQRHYFQNLADGNPDADSYLSQFGGDVEDHLFNYNPFIDGEWCNSRDVVGGHPIATTAGYRQRQKLEHFFPEIMKHLTFHRVQNIELRFKLTKNELVHKLNIEGFGADAGREDQLPVVRLRYEEYQRPIPDPFSPGQPMIVAHPRRELKRYPGAFDNPNKEAVINLSQDFSHIPMLRMVRFWVEDTTLTYASQPRNADLMAKSNDIYFNRLFLRQNGNDVQQYKNESEIQAYWNNTLKNEKGHNYYFLNQAPNHSRTGIVALSSNVFTPFLSMANIHDSTLSNRQHNRLLILDGVDNVQDTYELVLRASATLVAPTDELFVECMSWGISKVYPDGRVETVGLD